MAAQWGMKCLLVAAVLGLTGCGTAASRAGAGSDGHYTGKGVKVTLIKPQIIKSGKSVEYTVLLTKNEQPVKHADIVVYLEMANMDHGKNGFRARESGNAYKGKAVLPMDGDWMAYIKVKAEGTETTVQTPLKVVGGMMSAADMKKAGLKPDGSIAHPDF